MAIMPNPNFRMPMDAPRSKEKDTTDAPAFGKIKKKEIEFIC
jgi:hypothetical protein